MNQFIYVLSIKPEFRDKDKWSDEQKGIVGEHFKHLLKLKEERVLIMAGKTKYDVDNDENFGIVIFEADALEKALSIVEGDPAIVKGLMTAQLHPFNVAVIKN